MARKVILSNPLWKEEEEKKSNWISSFLSLKRLLRFPEICSIRQTFFRPTKEIYELTESVLSC